MTSKAENYSRQFAVQKHDQKDRINKKKDISRVNEREIIKLLKFLSILLKLISQFEK